MKLLPTNASARRATVALSAALALAAVAAPAQALGLELSGGSSMPAAIDASIPDDATLISSDYALLESGEVVSVADGSKVDPDLLGTPDTPPDPLSLTGGERFVPVSVGEARDEIASSGAQLLAPIDNGEWGASWGTYRNRAAFYMANGTMFVCQGMAVIDVSEHNGTIDWEAAKADGVDAAIIRIGFGYDRMDYTVARNIRECERLGIPYGIYLYSYAETPQDGRDEGANLVAWLRELGVDPDDLSLPVYYDLEEWVWTGHNPPTDPAVYEEIVRAWMDEVQGAGYTDASVYSYRSYLYGPLNSSYIHQHTSWAAEYGPNLKFSEFSGNFRGWQYSSKGSVDGIAGDVDLNAFGNATWAGQTGGDSAVNPAPEPEPSVSFPDVSEGDWCYDGVMWAAGAGLMGGNPDGTFAPNATLSRAQLAVVLWNRAGNPATSGSKIDSFVDIDKSGFYTGALEWCVENRYFLGLDDTHFAPAKDMTREELVVVLWRMSGMPASSHSLSKYPDAGSVSAFAGTAMRWAVEKGILSGQGGGTLDPQGSVNRAQAAVIFQRLAG